MVREVTPFLFLILVNASNNPSDKVVVIAFVTAPRYPVPLHCFPADHRSAGSACSKVIWLYVVQSCECTNLTVVAIAKYIRSTRFYHLIKILNSTVIEGW